MQSVKAFKFKFIINVALLFAILLLQRLLLLYADRHSLIVLKFFVLFLIVIYVTFCFRIWRGSRGGRLGATRGPRLCRMRLGAAPDWFPPFRARLSHSDFDLFFCPVYTQRAHTVSAVRFIYCYQRIVSNDCVNL